MAASCVDTQCVFLSIDCTCTLRQRTCLNNKDEGVYSRYDLYPLQSIIPYLLTLHPVSHISKEVPKKEDVGISTDATAPKNNSNHNHHHHPPGSLYACASIKLKSNVEEIKLLGMHHAPCTPLAPLPCSRSPALKSPISLFLLLLLLLLHHHSGRTNQRSSIWHASHATSIPRQIRKTTRWNKATTLYFYIQLQPLNGRQDARPSFMYCAETGNL